MKKTEHLVCNYAVLRFLPYPETGEFVNLGVVLHCPETGFFDLKLETRKTQRVTDLFPELDREAFKETRRAVVEELKRVSALIRPAIGLEYGRNVFRDTVRPRESVFRFSEVRTILTANPAGLAEQLYGQYVARHFARQKEYQETVMARRFYEALRSFRPDRTFRRNEKIGTDEYHVTIPICSDWTTDNGVPMRAIKPLELNRADATDIIDHGNLWVGRVQGLIEIGYKPERFIFAVNAPRESDRTEEAAEKVKERLQQTGVLVVRAQDMRRVLELATD